MRLSNNCATKKMSADANATLVFIPFPLMSHLVSAVETAKLLADRDDRLSITVLLMKLPVDTMIGSYTNNPPHTRINFLHLQENKSVTPGMLGAKNRTLLLVESQKGLVRDAVAEMMESQKGRLAGFVLDMFCTPMIDVANELGAPAYIFFPSGSAYLGLMLHLQSLSNDRGKNLKEYEDSDVEISIPTYANPVPGKAWPADVFDKEIVIRGESPLIKNRRRRIRSSIEDMKVAGGSPSTVLENL
ncbi:hydroquinone glucosyltransferase [Salvia divinorum]|uniref:Hydroquinone glucosyltransferase n=1 Tax=Salvia divinorum TaxID=28513 RepID=A0ABD1H8V1_SALDI